MFHAGDVAPSSCFLLQLLTFPGESEPLVGLLVGLRRPELESPVRLGSTGLFPYEALLVNEVPRSRLGVVGPVLWGLTTLFRAFAGPIAEGNLLGLAA